MHRLVNLSRWTIALTLALITLGGVVRATGAGLACPDWPLCHGRLIPPLQGLVLIEYSHRLLASIVGLVTLILVVRIWRGRTDGMLRWTALGALAILLAQGVLGGLTVLMDLTAALVAAHLSMAMLFLAALVVVHVEAWGRDRLPVTAPRGLRAAAVTAAALTFGQVVLGGYVSGSGAALACPDFPLCRGAVVPPLEGDVLIHFLHRLGALFVLASVAVLGVRAMRGDGLIRRLGAWAAGLVTLQVVIGALNIFTRAAPVVTVAHLFIAAALFATLVALLAVVWPAQELVEARRAVPVRPKQDVRWT